MLRPGVFGYNQYDSAKSGRILVDDTDGSVLQMESAGIGTPAELGAVHLIWSWDDVNIGDIAYLLPVAHDFVVIYPGGDTWRVAVQYKNHRHFEASANITFHP